MRNFYEKLEEISRKDNRYKPDAYEFVMQALWFTQKKLKKQGHISGRELLGGIKELVLDRYGPMAKTVFKHWGIEKTDDFGHIVFNMVENGILHKTEHDSMDDFKNVYDFNEAFDIFKHQSFDKFNIPKQSKKPKKSDAGHAKSGGFPGNSLN